MSAKTATTVSRFYEMLRKGDIQAVIEMFDPDADLTTPELPWSKERYRGREGLGEYFQGVFARLVNPGLEPEAIFAEGEQAVAYGAMYGRVRATGADFNVRFVHIWTVRDGLIVRCEGVSDSAPVVRAFAFTGDAAGG